MLGRCDSLDFITMSLTLPMDFVREILGPDILLPTYLDLEDSRIDLHPTSALNIVQTLQD